MATGDRVLLTVLLHHDQSKPLDEIMAHLKKTGFYRDFPPEGSELVSWVVAMSFVFSTRLRADRDRGGAQNGYRGKRAGGASRHRVSPAYDSAPTAPNLKREPACPFHARTARAARAGPRPDSDPQARSPLPP